MPFSVAKFSSDGLDLLSQLSSSKALRIKNIYVDETAHTASDLEQSPSWWSNQTSATMAKVDVELVAASEIDDQARLVVKINLKSDQMQTITAKTIVLTACGVESGVETSEITFCGVSDANGVEVLYNASGINLSTSVAVYFKFNSASSISFEDAIDPDYVVHSELDRFVSCHVVGDSTTGEAQDVLGHKTLKSGVSVVAFNNTGIKLVDVANTQVGQIKVDPDDGFEFKSQFTESDNYFIFLDENDDTLAKIYYDDNGDKTLYVPEKVTTLTLDAANIGSHFGRDFCLLTSDLNPSIDNYITLGNNANATTNTPKHWYKSIKSYNFEGDTFNSNSSTGEFSIAYDTQTVGRSTALKLGSIDFTYGIIGGINHTGQITFGLSNSYPAFEFKCNNNSIARFTPSETYISSTTAYFAGTNAYFDAAVTVDNDLTVTGNINGNFHGDLYGNIPYPASQNAFQTEIPVGCIFLLKGDLEVLRGDRIRQMDNQIGWKLVRTSAYIQIEFGEIEPSSANNSLVYSDFTLSTVFVALSHADANKPFLAMRIS